VHTRALCCGAVWCSLPAGWSSRHRLCSSGQQCSGLGGTFVVLLAAAAMASVSVASVMESIYQSTSMGRLEMRWWVAKIVDRKNAY
jgi:hypothetical protein